jgi:hypothetical protein
MTTFWDHLNRQGKKNQNVLHLKLYLVIDKTGENPEPRINSKFVPVV